MEANFSRIQWVIFSSKIPAAEISRETGIPATTINDWRNRKTDIWGMRFEYAEKLTEYSEKIAPIKKTPYERAMEAGGNTKVFYALDYVAYETKDKELVQGLAEFLQANHDDMFSVVLTDDIEFEKYIDASSPYWNKKEDGSGGS